jgi:hypothetical protein
MRYLLVALVAATACTVSAQTATKKAVAPPAPQRLATPAPATLTAPATPIEIAWEKEPDAFLGIKFNEPFNVAPCPTKTVGQYVKTEFLDYEAMKSLEAVCLDTTDSLYKYQKRENGKFKLAHLPALGIGYSVDVHTTNSVVSKITIDLKQSNFGVLLTAFKDRYSTPTLVESNTVKTNAGAEFNAADVTWKGKTVSIRMYERMGKVDESHVVISDNSTMEAEIAAQRSKRAAEAQKF